MKQSTILQLLTLAVLMIVVAVLFQQTRTLKSELSAIREEVQAARKTEVDPSFPDNFNQRAIRVMIVNR